VALEKLTTAHIQANLGYLLKSSKLSVQHSP